MKVLYISPTYFSSESVIGGGERYAIELARAMAKRADVRFLSFSDQNTSYPDGKLHCFYVKKLFSIAFIKQILRADIIHCYQTFNLSTDIAILLSRLFGKKVFVSDLGGASPRALSYRLPIHRMADAFLLISQYSKKVWLKRKESQRPKNIEIIYGGVDPKIFAYSKVKRGQDILFVGRLVAHKGIDYLIDAVEDERLHIVGRPYDSLYKELLFRKAKGKEVKFYEGLGDDAVIKRYQSALVTAQVSVHNISDGRYTEVPELLGLSALESMACGTPVIVSDAASLPEIVVDGQTGFVVPANDSKAIREKILFLINHPEKVAEMGKQAREHIEKNFTWDIVADKCLLVYQNHHGKNK